MLTSGCSLSDIRIQLGHEDLKATMVYAHFILKCARGALYGEHYQFGEITDNIMLSCQVKYILQSDAVKECPSFDIYVYLLSADFVIGRRSSISSYRSTFFKMKPCITGKGCLLVEYDLDVSINLILHILPPLICNLCQNMCRFSFTGAPCNYPILQIEKYKIPP